MKKISFGLIQMMILKLLLYIYIYMDDINSFKDIDKNLLLSLRKDTNKTTVLWRRHGESCSNSARPTSLD